MGCVTQPSEARAATKKHVILFLAANPPGMRRLSLDEEAQSILDELQRTGHRDRFEFVTRWAAKPLDLLRAMRVLKPTVVHFSGHGGGNPAGAATKEITDGRDVVVPTAQGSAQAGLYFHSAAGGVQVVTGCCRHSPRISRSRCSSIVLGSGPLVGDGPSPLAAFASLRCQS